MNNPLVYGGIHPCRLISAPGRTSTLLRQALDVVLETTGSSSSGDLRFGSLQLHAADLRVAGAGPGIPGGVQPEPWWLDGRLVLLVLSCLVTKMNIRNMWHGLRLSMPICWKCNCNYLRVDDLNCRQQLLSSSGVDSGAKGACPFELCRPVYCFALQLRRPSHAVCLVRSRLSC